MKEKSTLSEKDLIKKYEDKIQQEIVMYYRNEFCLKHHSPRCMIFSIPNESNERKAIRLMMMGLYPGCADLLVINCKAPNQVYLEAGCFRTKQLFFEVKAPENKSGPRKNGQSQKQIDFEEHCIAMGIPYHIIRSLDEFKHVIENL